MWKRADERITTVTWTNWTFGIWWGRIGVRDCFGIDLGPLEITWRWRWMSL